MSVSLTLNADPLAPIENVVGHALCVANRIGCAVEFIYENIPVRVEPFENQIMQGDRERELLQKYQAERSKYQAARDKQQKAEEKEKMKEWLNGR